MQDARNLFEAGKLRDAIAAMNTEVKSHPADTQRRGFLADLLCLVGNLERADMQFDAIAQQETSLAPGVALVRQLIRGEQARRQFFDAGRAPELVGSAPDHLCLAIRASIELRRGDVETAARLLGEAEALRPPVKGHCDGRAFDDFRDLDDLTAGFFEVITSTGKYFAIPIERVVTVDFRAPERPRDLTWRRAHMTVDDGPDGEVFLPANYVSQSDNADDAACLGRSTDWVGGGTLPTRGVGQRSFLIGDESVPIMQIGRLDFAPTA
ncbi:MAG: SciE type virulence protein [Rhodospirillales bacterium]|nr:SciE type virulence protein [Rhodospirillales bacterium]